MLTQLETISRWMRIKRVGAWIRRFLHNYAKHNKSLKNELIVGDLSVVEIQESERCILKLVQGRWFSDDIEKLEKGATLKKGSLAKFDPFLDTKGILRIGGRLEKESSLGFDEKFPIVLPRK